MTRRGFRIWQAALSSFGGALNRAQPIALQAEPARIGTGDPGPLRQAMQRTLLDLGGPRPRRLLIAIAGCNDVPGLWHLRGALMQAIAAARGEMQARKQVGELDALFVEAWPDAPVSRGRNLL
jgi:hypothetical protein